MSSQANILCEESTLKSNDKLPFLHFGQRLPARPSGADLLKIYQTLIDKAVQSVQRFAERHPNELSLHDTKDGSQPISYNLALTNEVMVLCPRRNGGNTVKRADGTELDYVELNGTLLAGTLMVKNEETYNLLKGDSSQLETILRAIGLPADFAVTSEQARV